ncbi:MAG: UDP-N-acetylmuramoyl-tripeptide--D-alanyl-D-alanine ligase [Bacteroidetes bacterium]|nr:UDP-N-acetylmuramoyl-tripeptide--D-alanyl-D-alanine ligase [Bacteroidota bacterium]
MKQIYEKFKLSSGVCTDTRNIQPNSLFIALKGANFNGNEFALQALEKGAKFAMVDEISDQSDPRLIHVDDCLQSLQQLGNYHRKQFNIPIIGITGSNGKTSTKELMAAVLSKKYNILATQGNLNNHIGVPLTLLGLDHNHELAIIEMGANKFKDIEELSLIAEPTHGIITNIGKAHLEGFLSFEGVLKTKLELYTSVQQNKGVVFQNAEDAILTSNSPSNTTLFSYGTEHGNLINGKLHRLTPYVELSWSKKNYQSPILETKMIGEYNFFNFLAAICIGHYFKVHEDLINEAVCEYESNNQRSQVQKTLKNTLIVDCYNANPSSMYSALSSFVQIQNAAKLAILGDMRELGEVEQAEHQKIIDYTAENDIKTFFVGPVFKRLVNNESSSFLTTEDLKDYLQKNEISEHLVLLKGSRGIALEKVIELL